MELLHSRLILRIAVSLAGAACLFVAISWIRATLVMRRTGNARRVYIPLPAFLELDFLDSMTDNVRLPQNLEDGFRRMKFKSMIMMNFMKAAFLIIVGITALSLVVHDVRGE
jgi:hypothetical protein